MATIETVNIEDVYPLVDEYGNNMATRDYSKKENIAYVKELARSFGEKGVPDELVTLVRDGGIFRVKAGNSRIEAMRKLGTKRFEAIIEDESTEQAILETVIRTNTKKKYEDLEMSSFVRQLAMFGDDEYVAEVSGMEAGDVANVRKAAGMVDDAADDMSLLHLMAIGEFADDPGAVERLTNCSEKEYERIANDLRKQREKDMREQKMRARLEELGVNVVDAIPDGMKHRISINSASGIPDDLPDGSYARYSDWNGNYSIYIPEGDAKVDPEIEKVKAQYAEVENLYEAAREHRESWLAYHINDDLSAVCELKGSCSSPYWYGIGSFIESLEITLDDMPARAINSYLGNRANITSWPSDVDRELPLDDGDCNKFIDLTDAMKKHGYEPCEEEETLYQLAQDHLAKKED